MLPPAEPVALLPRQLERSFLSAQHLEVPTVIRRQTRLPSIFRQFQSLVHVSCKTLQLQLLLRTVISATTLHLPPTVSSLSHSSFNVRLTSAESFRRFMRRHVQSARRALSTQLSAPSTSTTRSQRSASILDRTPVKFLSAS